MSAVILHAVSIFVISKCFQTRVGVFVLFGWCLMVPVGFFVVFGLCLMAPKAKLTAALFRERYGDLVSREHADCATARQLRIDLEKRTRPIVYLTEF